METTSKILTIKNHIDTSPQESDFEFKTEHISLSVEPGSNNVVVKTLYVSIDPYQINRMKSFSPSHDAHSTAAKIAIGEAIRAPGVGKVVASGRPNLKENDLVSGFINWGEYTLVKDGAGLVKVDLMGFPLSYHVGVLSFSGLTAYGGFFKVCKPKKGEKVFVSAASGSVGNLVGQYAKLSGCYVVGCAGTNEKVKILKEKLGFDDAFNYKEENNLTTTLKRFFPDGIDIYFDNVGANLLEAAVANMNPLGRVSVCGVISEYTDVKKRAAPNMIDIVYKRITMKGFLSSDFVDAYGEFISTTTNHLREGKLQVLEDISDGLESIPTAFIGLFKGANIGKKLVKVSND